MNNNGENDDSEEEVFKPRRSRKDTDRKKDLKAERKGSRRNSNLLNEKKSSTKDCNEIDRKGIERNTKTMKQKKCRASDPDNINSAKSEVDCHNANSILAQTSDYCKVKLSTDMFCPICQVPFNLLKIPAAVHTASCDVPSNVNACPDGAQCLNANTFHYRDFSHEALAAFRDSEDYVEPDTVFTPKGAKVKSTPRKSSGKKRPSKSPAMSQRKVSRKERDECLRKDRPRSPPVDEEYTLHEPQSSGNVVDSTKKQLFTDELNEEVWCSDLTLSEEKSKEEFAPRDCKASVKTSLPTCNTDSGLNQEENAGDAPHPSSAQVSIHYNFLPGENLTAIIGNKIDCPPTCARFASPEDYDSLQATCSIAISSSGINRAEAMARSPTSITLMLNKSGWEAVEIKGKQSMNVQNVNVSLCGCSHSVFVKYSVTDPSVMEDIKFDPKDCGQYEKFFATMTDLGLKDQNYNIQLLNDDIQLKKNSLLQSCNQLTFTSALRQIKVEESTEEVSASQYLEELADLADLVNEETNSSEANHLDGPESRSLELCKTNLGAENCTAYQSEEQSRLFKNRSSTSSTFSERTSHPSTPTFTVSKSTNSSWTLAPSVIKPITSSNLNGKATAQSKGNRKVPAYKRIPDSPIVVDAFNFGVIPGVKAYFLSHFHSDHYIGLRKGFNKPIFCSQVTANLVHLKLRVQKEFLHVLKFDEPRVVCGVEVEIYDANHCPGAVMFLFRLLDGRTFLHVGDFRANPSMEQFPKLKHVDRLYLDTTYCDPAYNFPSQEDVVNKVIDTVQFHLTQNKSTLFVCGTYTIGKEKVFMGLAKAFNFKIWTTGDKRKIFHCLEDKELVDCLENDPSAAQVHVVAMRDIALEELDKHLNKYTKYSRIVGFKPTGWTTSVSLKGKPSDFQKSSRGRVTIYGVPYSEHSSFSELRRFVRHIRPKDIQVTVNVSKSAQYKKMFQQWLSSNFDRNSQPKMDQFFGPSREPSL